MKRLIVGLFLMLLVTGIAWAEPVNLLVNGSFEEVDETGLPVGWKTSAYVTQPGYTLFASETDAPHGSRSVSVENFEYNDARFEQTVAVEPDSVYRLSGYVYAQDIPDSGWGANLSVSGVYASSEGLYHTDKWTFVEFYGETGPEQTQVTVYVRLGGYSGESIGRAMFDHLTLEKMDEVPDEVYPALWYREPVKLEPVETETSTDDSLPAWVWWVICLGIYGVLLWMVWPMLAPANRDLSRNESLHLDVWMALLLGGGLLLRLYVAWRVPAYQVDMNCFKSWGNTMWSYGPAGFYANCGFCDYPPGYLYILWFTAGWIRLLGVTGTVGVEIMYKLGPMLFDVAAAWLIYRVALGRGLGKAAMALGLVYLLNPAVILNSAAWGQVDSVLALCLVGVVVLAVQRKWLWALPLYGVAILLKPQALMMGPLGLCAFVMDWISQSKKDSRIHGRMAGACGLCVAAIVLLALPFSGGRSLIDWLVELYTETLSSYAYPTVNAANLYYLLGENWGNLKGLVPVWLSMVLMALCVGAAVWSWVKQKKFNWRTHLGALVLLAGGCFFVAAALLGCTWTQLGVGLMALAFMLVLSQYLRGGDSRFLPLLGANLLLLLYVFGVKMHERYLFPALALWALAYGLNRDRRILWLLGGSTVTLFINVAIILDKALRLPANQAHLNVGDPGWAGILSVVNILLALYSVHVGYSVCVAKKQTNIQPAANLEPKVDRALESLNRVKDHRLHMGVKDYVIMGVVTLVYSVVALWNLGSPVAPQTAWQSTAQQEQIVLDLGEVTDFRSLYFCRVSYNNFSISVSEDGESWSREYPAQMDQGQCFRWKYLMRANDQAVDTTSFTSTPQTLHGRYVRITAQQVGLTLNEMIFRDLEGQQLQPVLVSHMGANIRSQLASDPGAVIDEQDTLRGEPSWYNGTYFDEIYHARTAYEHAHAYDEDAVFPYETSHPPLGKVIMSWFVRLWGMTPFAWRFAGALTGILMLPAMYLLGKQLTKRRDLASAMMLLMAFDTMHLTQTRIATIDSFPVLFIILAFFFMLRFMQTDPWTHFKSSLWALLGSGVCMGLAMASKWIGVYAGIGLAVLYFWTCIRRLREHACARRVAEAAIVPDRRAAADKAARDGFKIVWYQCLWCILCFVILPLTIYYCSYIPYFAPDGGVTVEKVIEAAIGRVNVYGVRSGGMLGYHSTPGLGMDHPYYSPWWEWPLVMKPMWYASSNNLLVPEGMDYTIFCLGNPAVWWTGLAGLIFVGYSWFKNHLYRTGLCQSRLRLEARVDQPAWAFLLIAFGAQFLPWVLVPRGTYIYHYFASVPFIIACSVMMIASLKGSRGWLWAYVAISGLVFLLFYPYASGEMVSVDWLEAPKALLNLANAHPEWPQWLRNLLTWFPRVYY